MLTGDKGETAHNIGISCGLVDPERHTVFEIKSEELRGIADEIEFVNKKVMNGRKSTVENNSIVPSEVEMAS